MQINVDDEDLFAIVRRRADAIAWAASSPATTDAKLEAVEGRTADLLKLVQQARKRGLQ